MRLPLHPPRPRPRTGTRTRPIWKPAKPICDPRSHTGPVDLQYKQRGHCVTGTPPGQAAGGGPLPGPQAGRSRGGAGARRRGLHPQAQLQQQVLQQERGTGGVRGCGLGRGRCCPRWRLWVAAGGVSLVGMWVGRQGGVRRANFRSGLTRGCCNDADPHHRSSHYTTYMTTGDALTA